MRTAMLKARISEILSNKDIKENSGYSNHNKAIQAIDKFELKGNEREEAVRLVSEYLGMRSI